MKEKASKGETMFRRQAVKRKIWELEQRVDKNWAAKIDALIPAAEKVAAEAVSALVMAFPGAMTDDEKENAWNAHYHRKMNELAYKKQLRSWE
jgi:hypothetical protein